MLLLLDFTQLQALLWLAERELGWPAWWLRRTSGLLVVTADAWALARYVSGGGAAQDDASAAAPWLGYHALSLCLLVLAPMGALWVARRAPLSRWRAGRAAGALLRPASAALSCAAGARFWGARFGELAAAPAALALARALSCRQDAAPAPWEARTAELAWRFRCGSAEHVLAVLLALPAALAFCVALPLWLSARAREAVVAVSAGEHEAFLVQKECEWVLRLSPEWLADQLRLVSSFRLRASSFRVWVVLRKGAFAAGVVALRGGEGSGLGAEQIVVALSWAAALTASLALSSAPFRCAWSNRLLLAQEVALAFQLYLLSISASGDRSSLVSLPNLSRALVLEALLVCGAPLLLLAAFFRGAARHEHVRGAGPPPLRLLLSRPRAAAALLWRALDRAWPTSLEAVGAALARPGRTEWVIALHRAGALLAAHRFTPSALYPVDEAAALARELADLREAARAAPKPEPEPEPEQEQEQAQEQAPTKAPHRVTYQRKEPEAEPTIRAAGPAEALARSLDEAVEELVALVRLHEPCSLVAASKGLSAQQLKAALPELARAERERDRETVLMNRSKRRLLRGLAAFYRIGGGKLRPLKLSREDRGQERDQLAAVVLKRLASALDDGESHEDGEQLQAWRERLVSLGDSNAQSAQALAAIDDALRRIFT